MSRSHSSSLVEGMSTAEVETLTGISRFRLTSFIRSGIVSPSRASSSPQSEMRWTNDQIWLASKVPALLEGGFTLKEIAALAEDGNDVIEARLRDCYMQKMREGRRGLKDILCRERETCDVRRIDCANREYLRYLPQRYLALAPMPGSSGFDPKARSARLIELLNAAKAIGWSLADSNGFLSSVSSDGSSATVYTFSTLTSAPMPSFSGIRMVDGGCYFAVDRKRGAPGCDGASCTECTRFGREPSQADLFEWQGRADAEPGLWDRTIMMDDLAEPYPSGIWSEYTKARLDGGDPFEDGSGRSPTVRPRLMPHEVKLPLGITACVIPAGVFLCRQCDGGSQDLAFERMLGQASIMSQRPFTLEDELAASANALERTKVTEITSGPVPDPFSIPHITGDPKLKGWWREVTNVELQRLCVPTGMALAPEDGYCVMCSTLPGVDRNDPTRYEMQLLVDASDIDPPPAFDLPKYQYLDKTR